MRAAVGGQNVVVEMFDTQTQARDADLFKCLELCFLDGAGFALKRNFLGVSPTDVAIESVDEVTQLPVADVRRRAAAEVGETQLAALKRGHAAVELVLLDQRVEIDL